MKYNLPCFKEYIARNNLIGIQWWVFSKDYIELGFGTKTDFDGLAFRYKEHKRFVGRKAIVDIANAGNIDRIEKRIYVVSRMIESIYYGLDRYLSDMEKAIIMSEFTGRSYASWRQFMDMMPTTLTPRTVEFVKYGRRMLDSKSLYKYFEPKFTDEL